MTVAIAESLYDQTMFINKFYFDGIPSKDNLIGLGSDDDHVETKLLKCIYI